MTAPQPLDGDHREDTAQAVAAAIAAIFTTAEQAILAALAAALRKVAVAPAGGYAMLGTLRRQVAVILAAAEKRSAAVIRAAGLDPTRPVHDVRPDELPAAHAIPSEPATDVRIPAPASVPRLPRPPPAPALTEVSSPEPIDDLLQRVTNRVYRETADAYRVAVQDAIETARGGGSFTSLSLSRIQAAQKALDQLADEGITGFTDRAGRDWDLVSYIEMATRTAVSNAYDDLQNRALVRGGHDLVFVYSLSPEGSCPHCLPWLGKVLSLTGATTGDVAVTLADGTIWHGTVHATLAEARQTGFRHPSCRCSMLPVVNGMDLGPVSFIPVADDQAADVYEASQSQRALERAVRLHGRQSAAAITPAARSQAARKLAAARHAADAHAHQTGLRITQVGRKRREQPFHAH